MPDYNFCVGKEIEKGKQKITQIGVGFIEEFDANGKKRDKPYISIKLDLTVILGPNDRIYIFPNEPRI